jgi:hypothetical protein
MVRKGACAVAAGRAATIRSARRRAQRKSGDVRGKR